MSILITALAPAIGARVDGVSLAEPPDPAMVEVLEDALERHGVLLFPGQDITPGQQVAFSRAFAELELTERIDARMGGHPEIFVVGNTGPKVVSFAAKNDPDDLEWHADHMRLPVPARASLLYAREVPGAGGDTLFTCMYAAYDSLEPEERKELEGLTALHSVSGLNDFLRTKGPNGAGGGRYGTPENLIVQWPLVRRHPRSGRKSLYFGSKVSIGIEGWPRDRAAALFERLSRNARRPEAVYRHRWSVGDAVLWDNRRVLHAATQYDVERQRRELHRTTWREDRPIA